MIRLTTAAILLALTSPALSRPEHHARDRDCYDAVEERRQERRWERRRDEIERRERMESLNHRGAFNEDGSRRRFYDLGDSE